MTARALPAELLRVPGLVDPPPVAAELLRLARRPDASAEDVALALERDPALAEKLFRRARAAALDADAPTPARAILALGARWVRLNALALAFAARLPRAGRGLDHERFWRRGLARPAAARRLAALRGRPGEDEAFLCGLLADVGQLALAAAHPPFARVLEAAGEGWPDHALERATLGFHRGDVTLALLDAWGLPRAIALAAGRAADPDELPDDAPHAARELALVIEAARLAADVLLEASGPALDQLERVARERFALSAEEVGAYLIGLEGAFRDAAELCDLPAPTARPHRAILADARAARLLEPRPGDAPRAGALDHRESLRSDPARLEPGTGLLGEDGFHAYARAEIAARLAATLPHAFGVLLVAIDRFDALASDPRRALEAERIVAAALRRTTRRLDAGARLAPGAFALLAPECSPFGLRRLAERIRLEVQQQVVRVSDQDLRLTVSQGGACLGRAGSDDDAETLIAIARRYLASARAHGNEARLHARLIHGDRKAA